MPLMYTWRIVSKKNDSLRFEYSGTGDKSGGKGGSGGILFNKSKGGFIVQREQKKKKYTPLQNNNFGLLAFKTKKKPKERKKD